MGETFFGNLRGIYVEELSVESWIVLTIIVIADFFLGVLGSRHCGNWLKVSGPSPRSKM